MLLGRLSRWSESLRDAFVVDRTSRVWSSQRSGIVKVHRDTEHTTSEHCSSAVSAAVQQYSKSTRHDTARAAGSLDKEGWEAVLLGLVLTTSGGVRSGRRRISLFNFTRIECQGPAFRSPSICQSSVGITLFVGNAHRQRVVRARANSDLEIAV